MSDALNTAYILNEEFRAIHRDGLQPPNNSPQSESDYALAVHKLAQNGIGQTALCLSGGGIRSGAFALGLLQGLARRKLLSEFHYLSTVSGGGYIGGWLVAWASRPREVSGAAARQQPPFTTIQQELKEATPPPRRAFLTPRTGLASPDTWMAVAHVLRNMILNWIVFIPLLASLLLLPRLAALILRFWSSQTPLC